MSRSAFALLILATAWAPARADDDRPIVVEHAPPVRPADPPPAIRIVSPAPHASFTTHRVPVPAEHGDLACLLDNKDRVIQLAATNWTVKPGGPGVLVVMDGHFAATVHDLAAPIRMDDLEPYTAGKTDVIGVSPIASCGWHWIAAIPTAANGQILAVAPVVTWYRNVAPDGRGNRELDIDQLEHEPLLVVNAPLMGTFVPGIGNVGQPMGHVPPDLDKVALDYTIAQVPGCHAILRINGQDPMDLPKLGLSYIRHLTRDEDLDLEVACAGGAGGNAGLGLHVYDKKQRVVARAWPASSAALDARAKADVRAAHRLPGKHPYDGTYLTWTSGGMGALVCPGPATLTNGVIAVPIRVGGLSFGTVRASIDADGYIDEQSFKLGKPTPIRGKEIYDDARNEAAAMAGVIISGSVGQEHSAGKTGLHLEIKIEATDADGAKRGRWCDAFLLKKGYWRPIVTCKDVEDPDSCH